MALRRLFVFARGFSSVLPVPESFALEGLAADLRQCLSPCSARDFVSFSLFASVALSLAASSALFLTGGLAVALPVFPAFFVLSFAALLLVPRVAKRLRAASVEADLSFALQSAAVELSLGVPFEKVLSGLSAFGEAGKEFYSVLREVERGVAVPSALSNASRRVDSDFFKRACFELCFCYEHGLNAAGLQRLADEVSAAQAVRVRQFNSRMGFVGVVFVVLSCVVPALFGAYVIVGSSFLQTTFSASDVLLSFAVVFPLLDGLLLAVVFALTPRVLS